MTRHSLRAGEARRPTIEVHHTPFVDPEILRHLCAGIEEEGVPHEMVPVNPVPDALAEASRAAGRSMLGVGVGIADDGTMAVAHESFSDERAALRLDSPATATTARQLGHNAARIVTRLPLDL